jgi:arylsulfatase
LFRIDDDFAESRDVAHEHPDVVRRLVDTWWSEAGRNGVLPLDDSFIGRAVAMVPPPWGGRPRAVLRPGGGPVAEDTLPPLGGGFRLLAEVDVAGEHANGVIVALGDWNNGFACYLLDGLPVVTFNLFGVECRGVASRLVTPGHHLIGFEYSRERGGGGPVCLVVDGDVRAEVQLPHDVPFRWQVASAGLLVGRDRGLPVCDDYEPPFPFEGTIDKVVLESAALVPRDPKDELRAAIAHE